MSTSEKYIIIDKIKTKNQYEKVYLAKRLAESETFVLKSFNSKSKSSSLNYFREKAVNFEHKNICKLIDFFQTDTHYIIIREFLKGYDLQSLINNRKLFSKVNSKYILKITVEVLQGLKILHHNGIIHRDIRPSNIFLCIDSDKFDLKNEPNIKLIDFGMAKVPDLNDFDYYKPFALIFSSPEQVLKYTDLTNITSDIYSLGVTLWVLLNKKFPFYNKIPEIVANLQLTYNLPKTNKIPDEIYKIIQKATYKHNFRKSFKNYSRAELRKFMIEAQKFRYQSADEMIKDIKTIL